ncbi:MAG: toprim domain-containing protein, partial [Chitinophagaceae bacterium]
SSPKDITTHLHSTKQMTVFEGFFDFLSFTATLPTNDQKSTDFMVLNSLSFFDKCLPLTVRYDKINLYLDRDKAGHNCSQRAQALSQKFVDKSHLYKGYKDVNDWTMHMGKRAHKITGHL